MDINHQYYVYMITNKNNTVVYTSVTNNLKRRVFEHKEKLIEGFTKKYNVNKLIYCEITNDVNSAINREKQLKAGFRQKKINLINGFNIKWRDLYEEI